MEFAGAVRSVAKMPVMVTGGFRTGAGMTDALAAKELDVVGLGRPLIADPRTPARLPVDESRRYTWQDYINLVHPADRERINRAWDEALAGADYHVEYRIRRASDGVERWLESRGRALRDGSGKPVRVLGVVRDVTERHRYDEFRQLLPGILAHDLRSPLSIITLASRMILESATLPANGVRYAEATLRATAQIASMAQQLLEFTQARFGGGLPLDRTPVDLGEVCREAVFDARFTSPDSEVRFDVEGELHGRWDRTRLREVTSNLLGNATKYRAPGTPIQVAVRGESDHVVLTVHNHCAPIPAEMLPVLFDPFRYGDTAQRGPKSYGLGLYISREIVVAHGGTIDVSSSREAGTTFTVRLPRGTAAFAPASLNA